MGGDPGRRRRARLPAAHDLGSRFTWMRCAKPLRRADRLMRDAIRALVQCRACACRALPSYDDAMLRRELGLFPEWCVQREFGRAWTDAEQQTWQHACNTLAASALAQPVVAVPRLDAAQPDGGRPQSRHPRLPGRAAGPIATTCLAVARRLPLVGRRARDRLGDRYWKPHAAPRCGADDFGEFWRQLDGSPAAAPQGAGHLLPLKHRDGKPSTPKTCRGSSPMRRRWHALPRTAALLALLEPLSGIRPRWRLDALKRRQPTRSCSSRRTGARPRVPRQLHRLAAAQRQPPRARAAGGRGRCRSVRRSRGRWVHHDDFAGHAVVGQRDVLGAQAIEQRRARAERSALRVVQCSSMPLVLTRCRRVRTQRCSSTANDELGDELGAGVRRSPGRVELLDAAARITAMRSPSVIAST